MRIEQYSALRTPPDRNAIQEPGRAHSALLRVLIVAEGSGGHLIPALQTAHTLGASGATVRCWYAPRPQTAGLLAELVSTESAKQIHLEPMPISSTGGRPRGLLWRLWQMKRLWRTAQAQFRTFQPHVVVGFGGWISVPVLLAARQAGLPTLIHEQNASLGRANRLLRPWVTLLALSFPKDDVKPPTVLTGLPTRQAIGQVSRQEAANELGCRADLPTVLIVGGSQGSHAVNQLVCLMAERLTEQERRGWQLLHLTGPGSQEEVEGAYRRAGVQAVVRPYLAEMAVAYAAADVVISRAGASTIAELARCGLPGVLIPYPYAGGHQRHNARLVEVLGGGVRLEESQVQPDQLLGVVRQLLSDARLRRMMGQQMRTLAQPDAAGRLADVILRIATC